MSHRLGEGVREPGFRSSSAIIFAPCRNKGKKNDSTDGAAAVANSVGDETAAGNSTTVTAAGAAPAGPQLDGEQLIKIKKAMELLQLQKQQSEPAKTADDAAKKSYAFWSTQPVPKMDEDITTNEEIGQFIEGQPFFLSQDFGRK